MSGTKKESYLMDSSSFGLGFMITSSFVDSKFGYVRTHPDDPLIVLSAATVPLYTNYVATSSTHCRRK